MSYTPSCSLRAISFDDCLAATEVLRNVGLRMPVGAAQATAHWDRLWRRNPAVEGTAPLPLGWALEDRGRMVGFFGNVPLLYYLGEQPILVGDASQWGVEPAYRGETQRLAQAYFEQPNADLLLVTTGIRPTGRIFERFGGMPVPQPSYQEIFYWILDTAAFLEAALDKRSERSSAVRLAARLASPLVRATLFARGHGRGLRRRRVKMLKLDAIDAQFDELWLRKRSETQRLMACRDARTLTWHFAEGPYAATTHLLVARGSSLDGYLVVMREDAPQIGLKRLKVADALVAGDDPDILLALLHGALDFARDQGCHVLEFIGLPNTLRAAARRLRPLSRTMPVWPLFYCARRPDLSAAAKSESAWYVTPYDGDTTLV